MMKNINTHPPSSPQNSVWGVISKPSPSNMIDIIKDEQNLKEESFQYQKGRRGRGDSNLSEESNNSTSYESVTESSREEQEEHDLLLAKFLQEEEDSYLHHAGGMAWNQKIVISSPSQLAWKSSNYSIPTECASFDEADNMNCFNKIETDLKLFDHQKSTSHGKSNSSKLLSTSPLENSLDPSSRMIIYRMIQSKYFDKLCCTLRIGKEASVYQAYRAPTGQHDENIVKPTNFAIKIFKRNFNEFKKRYEYFDEDRRFSYKKLSNGDLRTAINRWTEKEFRNISRAYAAGLPVPQPIAFKDHCLLMTLITDDTRLINENGHDEVCIASASKQLKEFKYLDDEKWIDLYCQSLAIVFKLYTLCHLVHGDLSEYNLLLQNERVIYSLDFAQAVDLSHPRHLEFMEQDITRINKFFTSRKVNIASVEDILAYICHQESNLTSYQYYHQLETCCGTT